MESKAIASLADGLLKGALPDAQPWDIGAAVGSIADALARPANTISVDSVRAATRILNKRRHFEHAGKLCEAWSDCRGFDATIAKHHAQALINLSALDAADALLRDGLQRVSQPGAGAQAASEISEYEGLLARVDKQRFVATGNRDALASATDRYYSRYANDPGKPYWHGINAAALLAREQKEGVRRAGMPSVSELASAIYKQVSAAYRKDASDAWLASTASEASLALGKCEQAELWLYRFLNHPNVQPFDVESYGRQLREIWLGSAATTGGGCADQLAAIVARHVLRTQSSWSVSSADVREMSRTLERDPKAFEKNFSGEGSFSVDTVRRMLAKCASIGCVTNRLGERLGTGFLVDGAWLKQSFGALPVFVTNAHVISDKLPNAIAPHDARVTFEVESAAADAPILYKVTDVLFTSPPGDLGVRTADSALDATVVRLEALAKGLTGLDVASVLPLIDSKTKAYVVGHPRGSGLQIALHDSMLLDIDDDERLIHYRTPTDPGSSGSPVFNGAWEIIALHHGGSSKTPRLHGSGSYEANEGIALSAIRRALST